MYPEHFRSNFRLLECFCRSHKRENITAVLNHFNLKLIFLLKLINLYLHMNILSDNLPSKNLFCVREWGQFATLKSQVDRFSLLFLFS